MRRGSILGQTLIKVEPSKIRWVVKFVQKWNLEPPPPHLTPPTIRNGRILLGLSRERKHLFPSFFY